MARMRALAFLVISSAASHNIIPVSQYYSHLAGDSDSLGGGAYPLSTFDILALAALVWLAASILKAAKARLDRPLKRD